MSMCFSPIITLKQTKVYDGSIDSYTIASCHLTSLFFSSRQTGDAATRRCRVARGAPTLAAMWSGVLPRLSRSSAASGYALHVRKRRQIGETGTVMSRVCKPQTLCGHRSTLITRTKPRHLRSLGCLTRAMQ